jgi:hypothetical protein
MKPSFFGAAFLAAVGFLAGCSSFTTVTLKGGRQQIEAVSDVIATVCRSQGYRLSHSREPIRGYNRYSNDPRNQVVRRWEKTDNYPTIYEFWREGRFVVLIDTRNSLSRRYGEELGKKLREVDPRLDVIVEDQNFIDFT